MGGLSGSPIFVYLNLVVWYTNILHKYLYIGMYRSFTLTYICTLWFTSLLCLRGWFHWIVPVFCTSICDVQVIYATMPFRFVFQTANEQWNIQCFLPVIKHNTVSIFTERKKKIKKKACYICAISKLRSQESAEIYQCMVIFVIYQSFALKFVMYRSFAYIYSRCTSLLH